MISDINRHIIGVNCQRLRKISDVSVVITAAQMRAARALLGIDQRQLAELAGISVPTIQRMEASADVVRGNVDSLMRLLAALESAGVEVINEGAASTDGGRGVRLRAKLKSSESGATEPSRPFPAARDDP
ncbi:helix-turn-helix domain-containing protein (plasmid) [Rhizobium leguminosarum bv. trifolii]|nr:helix-turn-helix transcriptional regulator [Rhizobium ruizarguesonis]QIO49304.1 helix-turn-helix domain-containing protein [Rhizobium leguminosarum bv. trifolii]QJS32508.1 helix-turn-helix domain-containing protein [Rhizobium leguminosarum bv. trifolii TA1]QND37633.1 helix-turn-helix domain-containing protein [Rhizobium leguminosarum bv. viciae]